MKNRIHDSIARNKSDIANRLATGTISTDQIKSLHSDLDLSLDEYSTFQELKSLAVASGKLSHEEGMTVFHFLGNVPSTYNKQKVEVKVALTQLFVELLASQ